jgi:hypothetical protein
MENEPLKGASGIGPLFTFPHPVNEYASRSIAGLTFVIALLTIVAQFEWMIAGLVYLFAAGVIAGPKLTPTGWLTTKVIMPKLIRRKRPVAGPPKQFAQGVGLVLSTVSLVLAFVFGMEGAAYGVLGSRSVRWLLRRVFCIWLPDAVRACPGRGLPAMQRSQFRCAWQGESVAGRLPWILGSRFLPTCRALLPARLSNGPGASTLGRFLRSRASTAWRTTPTSP